MKKSFSRLHILVGALLLLSVVFVGTNFTPAGLLGATSSLWGKIFGQQQTANREPVIVTTHRERGVCKNQKCVPNSKVTTACGYDIDKNGKKTDSCADKQDYPLTPTCNDGGKCIASSDPYAFCTKYLNGTITESSTKCPKASNPNSVIPLGSVCGLTSLTGKCDNTVFNNCGIEKICDPVECRCVVNLNPNPPVTPNPPVNSPDLIVEAINNHCVDKNNKCVEGKKGQVCYVRADGKVSDTSDKCAEDPVPPVVPIGKDYYCGFLPGETVQNIKCLEVPKTASALFISQIKYRCTGAVDPACGYVANGRCATAAQIASGKFQKDTCYGAGKRASGIFCTFHFQCKDKV